jgi:hypothetical protein
VALWGIDLFGQQTTRQVTCSVFHDEREDPKRWLYHGFLFVPTEHEGPLIEQILKERTDSKWDKELHFQDLKNTRTMNDLAIRLTNLFCNYLHGSTYFYFFGVDYTHLAKEMWADRKTRDHRIYNRFFQIGLYSAIKWFFLHKDSDIEKVSISKIYSDKKDRAIEDLFHSMPITDISFKAFIKDEPIEFVTKTIIEVDSDHERETKYKSQSHIVQLVDLILGGFGQALDATSEHDGKVQVAQTLTRNGVPNILMVYDDAYFSSSYYKRYCVSFFPRTRMTKEEVISEGVFRRKDQFYNSREVKTLNRGQDSLF